MINEWISNLDAFSAWVLLFLLSVSFYFFTKLFKDKEEKAKKDFKDTKR